ncbi:MAG: KilA-N domain-containing protein [Brevinema sp.]
MVKVGEVEIKNHSWMQIIINKEDGYVNGSLLADQIGMGLYGFLELEDIKESIEHIKVLTGNKEKYEGVSYWDNVKGVYLHPFLALEMAAMKKNEDHDYEEYYEFLKKVITEDNKYKWIEEFHG